MRAVAEASSARPPPVVATVVREHAERAAFFWAQRDTLLAEDAPDERAVADVGVRLEANLDGLRIAGAAAWPFVVAAYEDFPEKGELFLWGWMAIEEDDGGRLGEAIELGRGSADDARGLVGALAWHKAAAIGPLVRGWIGAPDAFARYLAASACLEHGVDPKEILPRLVRDPDARVRAVAARLAGRLGRADLVGDLAAALDDGGERVRFWAAWSLAALGKGDLAGPELRKAAVSGGSDATTALRAAVKAAPDKEARAWMGGLLKQPETAALAVRGAGMLGDRTLLPWLVRQMREPALAPAAGASLLELFPQARQADLFTTEPAQAGAQFEARFGDEAVRLPLADKVKAWATNVLKEPL